MEWESLKTSIEDVTKRKNKVTEREGRMAELEEESGVAKQEAIKSSKALKMSKTG